MMYPDELNIIELLTYDNNINNINDLLIFDNVLRELFDRNDILEKDMLNSHDLDYLVNLTQTNLTNKISTIGNIELETLKTIQNNTISQNVTYVTENEFDELDDGISFEDINKVNVIGNPFI